MKQAYLDLDLIQLSTENAAVHLNKEFVLIDNLDEVPEQTNMEMEFVNHPVKLSFTIAIFCLTGRMSVQINLQEFELRATDCLGRLYRGVPGDERRYPDCRDCFFVRIFPDSASSRCYDVPATQALLFAFSSFVTGGDGRDDGHLSADEGENSRNGQSVPQGSFARIYAGAYL